MNSNHQCPVEGCNKIYTGKSAQGSLQRHIRLKHPQFKPMERVQDSTTTQEKRREWNRKYNTKYPMRSLALTRLKALKTLCSAELEDIWNERKPKRVAQPVFNGYIDQKNVYYLLEEKCGVYAGRCTKKYEWDEANRVCK